MQRNMVRHQLHIILKKYISEWINDLKVISKTKISYENIDIFHIDIALGNSYINKQLKEKSTKTKIDFPKNQEFVVGNDVSKIFSDLIYL